MRKLTLLAVLSGLAGMAPAATISLIPAGGAVAAPEGQAVGWGFNITNDSPVSWISFVASFTIGETNPGIGSYIDLIGPQGGPVNFALAPNTSWGQGFDFSNGLGLGAFLILPGVPVGEMNSGSIRVVWDSYDGDPSTCNCIPAQFSADVPFQVTVTNTPEPGMVWLIGGGLVAMGLHRARRLVKRALLFVVTAAPMMAQFNAIVNWSDTFGSCGAPGGRLCSNLKCSPPAANGLRIDPFTAQSNCDLDGPFCTSFLLPQTSPLDVTFLIATDLHFLNEDGITTAQHIKHVAAMNILPSLGLKWSDAAAGMDPVPIATPKALVTTGDDTHYGHQYQLGAFRLLYEQGRILESIRYPLLAGLGNHDVYGQCELANCGRRMFNYVGTTPVCSANVDPVSHSYSWDFGKYHMVQLNSWVGDTGLGEDTATGIKASHGSGIAWLALDLAQRVGNSGRPVIFFQHFGWDNFSLGLKNGEVWWTAADRALFLSLIKNYNVAGIFSGHEHITGMHATEAADAAGTRFDNFTGGNGGIGGDGQFFAVRLTEKYMDVVPFEWAENVNLDRPAVTYIGNNDSINRYFINHNEKGCRKLTGPAPGTLPFTVSLASNTVTITNNTGAAVQGPFALKVKLKYGDTVSNMLFTESCALGPVYTQLNFNSLAAGATVTVPFPKIAGNGTYVSADVSVAGIGSDSILLSPGAVTLTNAQPESVDVTSLFGRAVPFTFSHLDNWFAVNSSSNTTPATLTIKMNPNAASFAQSSSILIHPTVAGLADVKLTVNLGKVPVTVSSTLGNPVEVDRVSYPSPQQFSWYPGDQHRIRAADRTISPGTVDRFASWSDGGASEHQIIVPADGGTYTATYGRYYQVTSSAAPAASGQIAIVPGSSDGYYASGSVLNLTATPAKGYAFAFFGGVSPQPAGASFNWTLNAPLSVAGNFSLVGSYLISTSLGPAGSETVDGQIFQGPATVQWAQGTQHQISVPLTLVYKAGARDVFMNWSDGVTTASRTVMAGGVSSYLALYKRQYVVTTSAVPASGGTVSGAGWYDDGQSAQFRATPSAGYLFTSFSGDASGAGNPVSLVITNAVTVTGNFRAGTPALTALPGPRNNADPLAAMFTLVLSNNGAGIAAGAVVDSVTTRTVAGTGTVVASAKPLGFGDIPPGQSASQVITLAWPTGATRVAFTVHFTANGGAYAGQSTFYVLR